MYHDPRMEWGWGHRPLYSEILCPEPVSPSRPPTVLVETGACGTRDLGPGARDSPGTEGGPEGRRCSTEGWDVWVHTPFPLECGAEPAPAGHALQGGHAPTGEERK